jgi:hypothetical protein
MNNLIEEFKKAIKNLKVNKQYTKEFWDSVNKSIEKRYTKCKQDDKKRTNVNMNKRFDV